MPTSFSLTFDGRYGMSLVAGEAVILDLTGVHIERHSDGTYSCSITRGAETPVRLVASATAEGRGAIERANGRECPAVPGFVEAAESPSGGTASILRDEIARAFGWAPEPEPAPAA